MLGDVAGFGEAGIADDLLEPGTFELPIQPLKRRIRRDLLGNLGVREGEAERTGTLIQQHFRDDLSEYHPVQAQLPRLLRADRPAGLAGILLQPIIVERTELLDRDLGMPDLGHG